jgi:hypothetical protein
MRLVQQACETGRIPHDLLELTTMDWAHGKGKRFVSGQELDAGDADELQKAWQLIRAADDIRVERPA